MTGAIQRMMPTPFPLLPVEMKTEKARAAVEVPSETVNPCPNYNFAQLEAIADYQVMGYKPVAVPDALDHIQVVMNKSFRYVPPYVGPSTSLNVGACKDHVLFCVELDEKQLAEIAEAESIMKLLQLPDSAFEPAFPGFKIYVCCFTTLTAVIP